MCIKRCYCTWKWGYWWHQRWFCHPLKYSTWAQGHLVAAAGMRTARTDRQRAVDKWAKNADLLLVATSTEIHVTAPLSPPPHRHSLPSGTALATDVSDTASYSGQPGTMPSDMRDAPCINNKKAWWNYRNILIASYRCEHFSNTCTEICNTELVYERSWRAIAEKIVRHRTMNCE